MSAEGKKPISTGIVFFNATMSLDGFIAGPDDDMKWIFAYNYPDGKIKEITDSIGSLLVGKKTYNVGNKKSDAPTSEAYQGAWKGPEYILTHEKPTNDSNPNKHFITDTIENAVKIAKEGANGKDVNVLGANIAKQCIEHQLLDELTVFILPILLGKGTRLFDGSEYVHLEKISTETFNEVTAMRFKIKY